MSTTKTPAQQVQEALTLVGRLFVQAQDAATTHQEHVFTESRVNAALRLDLDGIARELEELRVSYAALEAERDQYKQGYESLSTSMIDLGKRLGATERTLTAREHQCKCAEDDVNSLQAQNEELQAAITLAREQRDHYCAKVRDLQAEKDALHTTLNTILKLQGVTK